MPNPFPKSKNPNANISKTRFLIGIILGSFHAFITYAFAYLIREVFRLFSGYYSDMATWFFSDNEVEFYNIVFAFFSVIIGHYVCLNFCFNKPHRLFSPFHVRQRQSIINDQTVLKWSFLSWFSGLSLILWVFTGLFNCIVFTLYPIYNYLFILLIIVLFLQMWTNIRRIFKKQSLGFMFFLSLIVIGLSFSLSTVDIGHYAKNNKYYQESKLLYKYALTLPKSDYYTVNFMREKYPVKNIYVMLGKENLDINKPFFYTDSFIFTWEEFCQEIEYWSERSKMNNYRMHGNLFIDKNIKMDFINSLKEELSLMDFFDVSYIVQPTDGLCQPMYYIDYEYKITAKIIQISLPDWSTEEMYKKAKETKNPITIHILKSGDYIVNDMLTKYQNLKTTLQETIQQNLDFALIIYPDDEAKYSDYIHFQACQKAIYHEIRDDYALANCDNQLFKSLSIEDRREVLVNRPLRYVEITEKDLENWDKRQDHEQ